jgi:hypothetical protein
MVFDNTNVQYLSVDSAGLLNKLIVTCGLSLRGFTLVFITGCVSFCSLFKCIILKIIMDYYLISKKPNIPFDFCRVIPVL